MFTRMKTWQSRAFSYLRTRRESPPARKTPPLPNRLLTPKHPRHRLPPTVAAEPIEIPDIKDAVSAPELPEVTIASSSVLLPADVAKTAPPVVNHYPQRDISAPAVAGQTPYDPLAALPSPDQNSASILIPASASKPLAKQASNSTASQRPAAIGEISLPSTTMPFSNALGYVPNIALSAAATTSAPLPREVGNRVQNQPPSAEVKMPTAAMPFAAAMAEGATYPGVPVPVTPSAAKMAVKTAAVPLSAPAVVSGVADAPVWLSVTEPSIVRPAAENVKAVDPENCAADCGSKVGTIAPAELPVGTSVRPEAADTTNNPPVAFIPNRNQAIVETNRQGEGRAWRFAVEAGSTLPRKRTALEAAGRPESSTG